MYRGKVRFWIISKGLHVFYFCIYNKRVEALKARMCGYSLSLSLVMLLCLVPSRMLVFAHSVSKNKHSVIASNVNDGKYKKQKLVAFSCHPAFAITEEWDNSFQSSRFNQVAKMTPHAEIKRIVNISRILVAQDERVPAIENTLFLNIFKGHQTTSFGKYLFGGSSFG